PKRKNTAGHGERNSGVNEQRLSQAAEREKDQNKYQSQCSRNDNGKTRPRLFQVFVGAAEFKNVTFRHFYFLFDSLLGVVDESFNVARLQIDQECCPPASFVAQNRLDHFARSPCLT